MPKKGVYVKFKKLERKIKSPVMIYADFESILEQENNGKKNSEDTYMNKYQKHVAWSYGYKLVRVNDNFSKPFQSYLGEDAVYIFINSMIEESKHCTDIIKKYNDKSR